MVGAAAGDVATEVGARIRSWLTVVVVSVLTTGCSSLRVSHDYALDADFSELATYAWIQASGDPTRDRLLEQRATAHVDRLLAAMGYEQVDAEPDFLVAVHDDVQQRLSVIDLGYGGSYGYGGYAYGSHWGAFGSRRLDVTEYDEGVLIIDVIEPEAQRLIWRGIARRPQDYRATPVERDAAVAEAVEALLARFPPDTLLSPDTQLPPKSGADE